jgi:hypothetical protein
MRVDEICAQYRERLLHISDTVELKLSQFDMIMSHVPNPFCNKKTNTMTKVQSRFTHYHCLFHSTDAQHSTTPVVSRISRIQPVCGPLQAPCRVTMIGTSQDTSSVPMVCSVRHSLVSYFLLLFLKDILPDLLFSFLIAIFSACFSTFLSIASFSPSIACGAL